MIKKYNLKHIDNIILVGDIHGNFNYLFNRINNMTYLNNTLFIVCGDIGLGFHKDEYYKEIFDYQSEQLKENNNHIAFIRGNHDNPKYFNGEHNKLFDDYKNIHVTPDYSVIETKTEHILLIGGAVSIDRVQRIKMDLYRLEISGIYEETYWVDEEFEYDDEKINHINDLFGDKISVVCSHSAPIFATPYSKNNLTSWFEQDDELEDDIDNERNLLTQLYNNLLPKQKNLKVWGYGHFHTSNLDIINDIKFKLLDILEFFEIK